VVPDHPAQEQPVERAPPRVCQLRHLLLREHPHHRVVPRLRVVEVARVIPGLRDLDALLLQPRRHRQDLGPLCGPDPSRHPSDVRIDGVPARELGHLHRLCVVRDHHLHERDVGVTRLLGDRLVGRPSAGLLAWSARLDDGQVAGARPFFGG
jgi:hypothetical protein